MQGKKNLNVEIGANIKRAREQADLTQERLSELIGIGPKSLSAIERGVVGISLASLRKVCKVLSISSDAILFGEPTKHDMGDLPCRLERLTPPQYQIASEMLMALLEAFHLPQQEQ